MIQDPNQGELVTSLQLKLSWNDVNLHWDPKKYDNLTVIHLPLTKIWQPDIRFRNRWI